jgi:hypothetical protein
MSDPMRSPSEAMRDWVSTRRLHRMTWLIIVAGLLHLVGDIVTSLSDLARMAAHTDAFSPGPPKSIQLAGEVVSRIGYSLWFFGTAATVEYLARIWEELRLRRGTGDPPA